MDKRTFLKSSALLGLGGFMTFPAIGRVVRTAAHLAPEVTAGDDDFWSRIRGGYKINPDFINLENGFYCIQPQEVLDKYFDHLRQINLEGAHYMRTVQADNRKVVVKKLADLAGCSADELIITRNTTESLDMIISGYGWKAGDEAIVAEHDYGAMLEMFKQVSKRNGVVIKKVSVPVDPGTDDEIVNLYASAITPDTRLLMVCHMINISGQILPVRKICDMAHSRGVQVMVDGAHAFAHLEFAIPDLNCDYYGSSLHKWLSTPLGAGLLYVKKENIGKVWPLLAEGERKDDDISRLNHMGTTPVATDLAIADAIDFYRMIGAGRKEARLRHLQNYWVSRVRHLPNVVMNTPADPARSCAIANVGIKGMNPGDLASLLMQKYKIYTVAIDSAGIRGCRITPNIFTTTAELDVLVDAIKREA